VLDVGAVLVLADAGVVDTAPDAVNDTADVAVVDTALELAFELEERGTLSFDAVVSGRF
jgi:hypothetical protein